jgi:hypothetical protein
MITTLEHVEDGRTRRATITRGPVGWRYQEQYDSRVVRDVTYTDWHRVERAIQAFERSGGTAHSTNR